MDEKKILAACDHTLLKQTATWPDIRQLIDDAVTYGTASVCIPPCFVKQAKDYAAGRMPICTVIGFPNGYSTTGTKVFEAWDAVRNGADEIDMVINVGMLKSGKEGQEYVLNEINLVKEACGNHILKVIIEACLLDDEEKERMCHIINSSKADFIKTSTGFSTGGATFRDVELFSRFMMNGKHIKAAGGISSLEDAERFMNLGAERLGTSRVVKIIKEKEKS